MNIQFSLLRNNTAFLTFLLAIFFCVPVFANAQSVAGIEIKPALIEEAVDPGAALQTTVTITNRSQNVETYYMEVRDIYGVDDDATPLFLETGERLASFGVADWITLSTAPFVLNPGESRRVPVTILVPSNAPGGSHFGAIFASVKAPEFGVVGAAVGYEVPSIVSLRVSGDVVEAATVRSFRTDAAVHGTSEIPLFTEIENEGNTLLRPIGTVDIFNMVGKQVASIPVNETGAGVFPNAKRVFESKWNGSTLSIGKYTAVVALAYGEVAGRQQLSAEQSFWVLPIDLILMVVGGVLAVVFSIYLIIRTYIRSVLKQMGHTEVYRPQNQQSNTITNTLFVILFITLLLLVVIGFFIFFI